ncbi:hypothetical protein BXA13_07945 [Campylobacter lari]|uniref:Sugar transferase n=1 Tax=Campylobacter lari TaxID=201 RepID=A0A7U8BI46_CAMLA|nr:hypothetical protein [Campylobacter lari]
MKKYILSNRTDANAARLLGIINAFYIAEKLNTDAFFTWNDELEKYVKNRTHLPSDKLFDKQKIIGVQIDTKEDIFNEEYLKKHCINIENEKYFSEYSTPLSSFNEFKNIFLNENYKFFEIPFYMRYSWKDIDLNDYLSKASIIWDNIGFNEKILKIIKDANDKAKQLQNYISIHIRNSDTVYSYAEFRKYNDLTTYHATPYELVLELIKENKDQNIVIFSDDVSSVEEMIKTLNMPNLLFANDFRDFEKLTPTQMLIYDVVLMSKSKKIYGTHSSVTRLASAISNHGSHINPYDLYNHKKRYEIIKNNINILNLHNDQKAFSLFHLYLSGIRSKIKLKILQSYLEEALKLDYDNDKYRIYIIDCLLKQGKAKEADEYIEKILQERSEEFLNLLIEKIEINQEFYFKRLFINYTINAKKGRNILYIADYLKKHAKNYINSKKNKILLGKILNFTYAKRFF